MRSWDTGSDGRFTQYIRGIIAVTIASARERKASWATLARDHLGVAEGVFQDHLTQGDSVLPANLIHFMRHASPFAFGVVHSLQI